MIRAFFYLLFLCGCSSSHEMLQVQSNYITREELASSFIGTPDPKLWCPPQGQRVTINWTIPTCLWEYGDLYLVVTFRFSNQETCVKHVPLERRRGIWEYRLLDDDYFNTGGIQTYKVDLFAGEIFLESWRHQLWAEKIVIEDETHHY